MQKKAYVIEQMSLEDLALASKWAEGLGWNPGLHDTKVFYPTCPSGFFVGKLEGKPIAFGSAVIYDEAFAFCGLYMVDSHYRGQGYGLELTKARLASMGDRNAGLDGVLDMVDKYARLGYKTSHYNTRYKLDMPNLNIEAPEIIPVSKAPFEAITAYDATCFPAKRAVFLKHWLNQKDTKAYAWYSHGKLEGYGVIRKCVTGYRVGPLFANDKTIAEALLSRMQEAAKGEDVFIDCPENNAYALKIAKQYDFEPVFKTARMYLKYEPDINTDRVYGITTLELG